MIDIKQDTDTVLMVRPSSFGYNPNTAETNVFQNKVSSSSKDEIASLAVEEFNGLVKVLENNEVNIVVADDTLEFVTPDAVFPNNWISFHEDGTVVLYPMLAPERRLESKLDVFSYLKNNFNYSNQIIDLRSFESNNKFLEGTGSIILDRVNKKAYACISERTNLQVLNDFGKQIGYEIISFLAVDENDIPIYHTNVILSITNTIVVACTEVIKNKEERQIVEGNLLESGRDLIKISLEQVKNFCGNVLGLKNNNGCDLLVMSSRAYNGFTKAQVEQMEKKVKLIHAPIPTIEHVGGGSVRCMLAAVHLPKNN